MWSIEQCRHWLIFCYKCSTLSSHEHHYVRSYVWSPGTSCVRDIVLTLQPHCYPKVSESSKTMKGVKKNFSYVSLMTNNIGYFFIGLVVICFFPFGFIFIDFYLIFNAIYFLFSPSAHLSSSLYFYTTCIFSFSLSLSINPTERKKNQTATTKKKIK